MASLVEIDNASARIPGVLADFPPSLSGELCWNADTFRDAKHKYIVRLASGDIRSIEKATAFFKSILINASTRPRLTDREHSSRERSSLPEP